MASTPARRRLPIWLSAVLGLVALTWFTAAILIAITGAPPPAAAVRWTLLASKLSASALLAVTAWWGTRPRPETPQAPGRRQSPWSPA